MLYQLYGGKTISIKHMVALQQVCNGGQHGLFALPGAVQVVLALYDTVVAKWEAWDTSVGASNKGDGGLGSDERSETNAGGSAGKRHKRAAASGPSAETKIKQGYTLADAAERLSEKGPDSAAKGATKRIASALLMAGAARVCAEGLHGGEASGAPPAPPADLPTNITNDKSKECLLLAMLDAAWAAARPHLPAGQPATSQQRLRAVKVLSFALRDHYAQLWCPSVCAGLGRQPAPVCAAPVVVLHREALGDRSSYHAPSIFFALAESNDVGLLEMLNAAAGHYMAHLPLLQCALLRCLTGAETMIKRQDLVQQMQLMGAQAVTPRAVRQRAKKAAKAAEGASESAAAAVEAAGDEEVEVAEEEEGAGGAASDDEDDRYAASIASSASASSSSSSASATSSASYASGAASVSQHDIVSLSAKGKALLSVPFFWPFALPRDKPLTVPFETFKNTRDEKKFFK